MVVVIHPHSNNGNIEALAEAGINCWADKGYRGAGGTVRIPYWGRWENLSMGQQAVNRRIRRDLHPLRTGDETVTDLKILTGRRIDLVCRRAHSAASRTATHTIGRERLPQSRRPPRTCRSAA